MLTLMTYPTQTQALDDAIQHLSLKELTDITTAFQSGAFDRVVISDSLLPWIMLQGFCMFSR